MVLIRACRAMLGLAVGLCGLAPATAQDLRTATPVLDLGDPPPPPPFTIGGAAVRLGAAARVEYDDNIYAQAFGKVGDEKLILTPAILIERLRGTLDLSARAEASVRRFRDRKTENATAAETEARVAWKPSTVDQLAFTGGWSHVVEDRGEPEGRIGPRLGPRELDVLAGDLAFAHQGPIGINLRATASRYRYDDLLDRDRDLTSYAASARVSRRISPLVAGFAEGFVNRRDFVLPAANGLPNRDSTTWGGRVGAAIDPGGRVRGEAAGGVYRFDPKDPTLRGRTGLSAEASLIYQPTPRIALTLDGFVGNVATYRAGAQSRQDTRARIGIQQEVRHNLRWQTSLLVRRTRYYGTGIAERTYAAIAEVEYLMSRRVTLSPSFRFAKRTSRAPLEEFERMRAGLDLRVRF